MASSSKNDSGLISGINVTPLVDITLVLLIVFIVTAKIIVTPAVPLDLPQAAKSEEVPVVMSIVIPEKGQTSINGKELAKLEDLLPLAKAEFEKDPEIRVVISVD